MSLDTSRPDSRPERLTPHEVTERLEHERDSRLAQLGAIEEEAGRPGADDVARSQKASIERVLKEIDAAFERLENGGYGDCVRCGKAIPIERLEILPYARACVGCQHLVG